MASDPGKKSVMDLIYSKPVRLTVFTSVGDVQVHIHNATGYRIIEGYLMVLSGSEGQDIIATYNRDQWVFIRE